MGKLRDQMLVDLQLSGAKPSTQRAYLREVANLAKYFHKSPEELGEDELNGVSLSGYRLATNMRSSPSSRVSDRYNGSKAKRFPVFFFTNHFIRE